MSTVLKHRRGTTAQHSGFTGAQGEITVDTTKNTVVVHDGVTAGGIPLAKAADIPVVQSAINLLINGNFGVNQRAVSGTVTLSAGQYGHDRWKAGAGGCTYTFSTSGNDVVITVTAGSLMQVIEGKFVSSSVYTVSQSGTANARVAINGASTSGSYAALPITTAAATGGQNVTVEFTTGTINLAQVQPGTVSYPFVRRFNELQLCQRYGFPLLDNSATNEVLGQGYCTSTTNATIIRVPPVEMRALPSLSFILGAANNLNSNAGGAVSALTVSAIGSTVRQLQINCTGTGFTSGAATYIRNSGSTSVQLFADSEL